MSVELNDDGTITFQMLDGQTGNKFRDVKLRIPTVGEIEELWLQIDKITEEAEIADREYEAAKTKAEENDEPVPVNTRRRVASKLNLRWLRCALGLLGPEGWYEEDPANGEWTLATEEVREPAWFLSGVVAGRWLAHWTKVPLAPGSIPWETSAVQAALEAIEAANQNGQAATTVPT